jgi:ubiquinone/menaquinone biosynthesis C-methylase UbiE
VSAGNRERIQAQFGDKADAYATSALHADPAHLDWLLELVQPQPGWRVLDVATGAGHTAHAVAPYVAQVVASDVTAAMARKARELAQDKGLATVTAAVAAAEALPFAAGRLDLVTCRLAAHHFPDPAQFLGEVRRVLRPGGKLALVDNVVPGSLLSGKKARLQQAAGRYINALERLRDPSHVRCLSVYEWRQAFLAAGLAIDDEALAWKWLNFGPWAARMGVTEPVLTQLRVLLTRAPDEVLEFLTPQPITFGLPAAR